MGSIESFSEHDTVRLAEQIALGAGRGSVFLLDGPLGAGKSVFARGFIRALCGADTEVPSPTFTLVQTYDADIPVWHFDLYRLQDPDEVFEIGWEESLSGGIVLVEWPERAGAHLPRHAKHIRIEPLTGERRKISYDD